MSVEKIMVTKVFSVTPEMKLWEVAEFLIQKRISGAPVVDRVGNLLSVIGEGNLLRLAATEGLDATLKQCWEKMPWTSKLFTLKKHDSFADAYRLFLRHPIHRIPIVDDSGKVVGIISRGTILRMFIEAHYQKKLPDGV